MNSEIECLPFRTSHGMLSNWGISVDVNLIDIDTAKSESIT